MPQPSSSRISTGPAVENDGMPAWFRPLPLYQKQQLWAWLTTGRLSPAETQQRLAAEFGVTVSASALLIFVNAISTTTAPQNHPAMNASLLPKGTATPAPERPLQHASTREVAAEQLFHGLSSCFTNLHIYVLGVSDGGLLASEPTLARMAQTLANDASALEVRICKAYPACHTGRANHLRRQQGLTLAQETELYRQENFWTRPGRDSLIESEELIRDIHRFFRSVANLVRHIDLVNDHDGSERKYPDFRAGPNPYAEIIGD